MSITHRPRTSPTPHMPRIEQGELAYWLGVIADGQAESAPAHIVDALQILRCIEQREGGLRVTEKGLLSLRMADPAALHHQL